MPPPWINVFVSVPDTERVVWIVRLPFFDTPIQATWFQDSGNFQWADSNGGTHNISVNAVYKWRDL
jgi:hypothetical protein